MRELTKEQYEEIKKQDCVGKQIRKAYEMGLISDIAYMGYGIDKFKLIEQDGKYYMDYTTYDCCD